MKAMKTDSRCLAPNSSRVYFSLRGDFIPDDLTKAFGLEPTGTKSAGERIPGKVPVCSHWQYSIEVKDDEFVDVYELSLKLINQLDPFAERIAAEVRNRDLSATLQIVLWITPGEKEPTPAVGFDIDVIKFLAKVKGSIDVDIYKG